MDPAGHHAESTFDQLWDEARRDPGHVALGRLPDGWDGWVNCAVRFDEGAATVMLDFPADRLVAAMMAAIHDRGWRVVDRSAIRLNGAGSPLRYVLTLSPLIPLEPS